MKKPKWLRPSAPQGDRFRGIQESLSPFEAHTVCEEAHCPNIREVQTDENQAILSRHNPNMNKELFANEYNNKPKGSLIGLSHWSSQYPLEVLSFKWRMQAPMSPWFHWKGGFINYH
ncbi:Lipoyl synthase, N-terminal [Sesbania bispinosa]|nr:Lipoyl synthase, N-terminal [Sesbania bispinosa]